MHPEMKRIPVGASHFECTAEKGNPHGHRRHPEDSLARSDHRSSRRWLEWQAVRKPSKDAPCAARREWRRDEASWQGSHAHRPRLFELIGILGRPPSLELNAKRGEVAVRRRVRQPTRDRREQGARGIEEPARAASRAGPVSVITPNEQAAA